MFAMIETDVMQPSFWLALGKVAWIDILLSGDNALVIALACRGLAPKQRLWGMIFGAGAAIALRIALTGTVASLMGLPYLKIVGGLALLYVATKLLIPDEDEAHVNASERLLTAVRTIVIADIVMSIDNIIAVAAAAKGDLFLLAFALLLSIPLIVAGAAVISGVLNRLPVLVWAGAALLGWIAGDVIATDIAVEPYLRLPFETTYVYAGLSACLVIAAGMLWRFRAQESQAV